MQPTQAFITFPYLRRHWQNSQRRLCLSPHWRNWLCHRQSLTKLLIQASEGHFKVNLISLQRQKIHTDEALYLGLHYQSYAWVREVLLTGYEHPWVYARTIIPNSTLRYCKSHIMSLGNHSLGSLLFSDPRIHRGDIEICQHYSDKLFSPARRSIFYINQQPLLVTEFFLPNMNNVMFPK